MGAAAGQPGDRGSRCTSAGCAAVSVQRAARPWRLHCSWTPRQCSLIASTVGVCRMSCNYLLPQQSGVSEGCLQPAVPGFAWWHFCWVTDRQICLTLKCSVMFAQEGACGDDTSSTPSAGCVTAGGLLGTSAKPCVPAWDGTAVLERKDLVRPLPS